MQTNQTPIQQWRAMLAQFDQLASLKTKAHPVECFCMTCVPLPSLYAVNAWHGCVGLYWAESPDDAIEQSSKEAGPVGLFSDGFTAEEVELP